MANQHQRHALMPAEIALHSLLRKPLIRRPLVGAKQRLKTWRTRLDSNQQSPVS